MRLEVDPELGKILDEIKKNEHSVYGRGHVETVRFLANYYKQHKPFQDLYDDFGLKLTNFLLNLPSTMTRALQQVFPETTAQFISNLLTTRRATDANPPGSGQDPAASRPDTRRSSDAGQIRPDARAAEEGTLK